MATLRLRTLRVYFLNFTENAKEFSQEIRLTSTEDNLVNWVIGAYYYQQEIDLSTIVEWGAYPGIPDLLFGGAFGGFLVMTQGLAAGSLGIALFTVAVVAGQGISGIYRS